MPTGLAQAPGKSLDLARLSFNPSLWKQQKQQQLWPDATSRLAECKVQDISLHPSSTAPLDNKLPAARPRHPAEARRRVCQAPTVSSQACFQPTNSWGLGELRRLWVTFIDKEGKEVKLAVSQGDNLLDIAQAHDLEMEGTRPQALEAIASR